MPSSVIKVDSLTVRLENKIILEDVTFTVQKGDFIGLIGPNGAGKSTLLKCLLGAIPVSSGSVTLFGSVPSEKGAKRQTGYVPQSFIHTRSNFPLTVGEIVRSGIAEENFLAPIFSSQQERVKAALKKVNLQNRINDPFDVLSGGQKQRVAIARALIREPQLLLLDEPLTGVDYLSQESFYELLVNLNKDLGITILLVSHDVEAVTRRVSRILCLNQKLRKECHPAEFQIESGEFGMIKTIHHHHEHV